MPVLPRSDSDMGYAFPPGVIILFILLGAILLICCGYAIHKTFGFEEDGNGFKPMRREQWEYMKEVKARNMESLAYEGMMVRTDGGLEMRGEGRA